MASLGYTNTELLLSSLKDYVKINLKDTQKIVSTVKSGIIDERDELPMIMILPMYEEISRFYTDNLHEIKTDFRLDIINKAYHIEDLKDSLKNKLSALRALFSIETLGWTLPDTNGLLQASDFWVGNEQFGEPINNENQYTQYCSLPISLRSYFKGNGVLSTALYELTFIELLDYLYAQIKTFTSFVEHWRDISKPINLNNFPAIGVFLQNADTDKDEQSSTEFDKINVVFRIYSNLASREIAFINHLRNVETVKTWILNNSDLQGRLQEFTLSSIDYGIDNIVRPFQGQTQEFPVFRSDILTICKLINYS